MSAREYWSDFLEKRYLITRRSVWKKKPLEVVIMPHSHNDPGWLKTLEGYYNKDTKEILNNAVDQMTKYKNMTFVWTEMQFLAMWWSEAHPGRRRNLQHLIQEGRFEVLTGGWVMTDEANVNLFAMVDQLVEGHSWIRSVNDYVFCMMLLLYKIHFHSNATSCCLPQVNFGTESHSKVIMVCRPFWTRRHLPLCPEGLGGRQHGHHANPLRVEGVLCQTQVLQSTNKRNEF